MKSLVFILMLTSVFSEAEPLKFKCDSNGNPVVMSVAAASFIGVASIDVVEVVKDAKNIDDTRQNWRGQQEQAAMYAFMFFLERSYREPKNAESTDRMIETTTARLIKKIDRNRFEESVKLLGASHAEGIFTNYDSKNILTDLERFSKKYEFKK